MRLHRTPEPSFFKANPDYVQLKVEMDLFSIRRAFTCFAQLLQTNQIISPMERTFTEVFGSFPPIIVRETKFCSPTILA
jgi:hypothetical protein